MQYSLRCDDILWVVSCFLVLARLARYSFRSHRSSSFWRCSYGRHFFSTPQARTDQMVLEPFALCWCGGGVAMYFVTGSRSTVILSRIIPGGGLRSKLESQADCGICLTIVKDGKPRSGRCRGWLLVEEFRLLCMDFVTLFGLAM